MSALNKAGVRHVQDVGRTGPLILGGYQLLLQGTSRFSVDIGLTDSQSCRENSCFSVCIHALNDG